MVSWKRLAGELLDAFRRQGAVWLEPGDIPPEVRRRVDALCLEGTGRRSTDPELRALLSFST